jgi:hypothetical protein
MSPVSQDGGSLLLLEPEGLFSVANSGKTNVSGAIRTFPGVVFWMEGRACE